MKLNDKFAAGYAAPPGFSSSNWRKVVKCTIMIKKKAGMSDQDFVSHYNNKHARMATAVIMKYKPVTYSLTYNLDPDRKRMQDILHGKAQLLDYDAICTFVFPDWMCLARFMYDPECKALSTDHGNFMDESQMKMMVGDEFMLVEGGEKVG